MLEIESVYQEYVAKSYNFLSDSIPVSSELVGTLLRNKPTTVLIQVLRRRSCNMKQWKHHFGRFPYDVYIC
jgi:hypothetical protein